MHRHLRRVSALAVAALAAGALTLTQYGTASAATAYDTAPGAAATAWANAQLVDGALPSSYGGANTGATIDFATSLLTLDPSADVSAERSAVAAGLEAGYADADEYACPTDGDYSCDPSAYVLKQHGYYSGATAKALAFAEAAGADPTSYGDRDLVTQLENLVQSDGRLKDDSYWGDYANILGQAFAARGLSDADSDKAAGVVSFLLGQQCDDDSFPEQFDACDSGSSVDATATVVLQLEATTAPTQELAASVSTAVTKAEKWLEKVQNADGSWSSDGTPSAGNANSTGLAGLALGQSDQDPADAERAAAWVRAHQLVNVGSCAPYAASSVGALAFDDAAQGSAVTQGTDTDQFRIAVSQALGVLKYAPAGGTLAIAGPVAAQQPGASATYTISGGAPGETVCVTAAGAAAQAVTVGADGTATVRLTLPTSGTGYAVTATSAAATATATTTIAQPVAQPVRAPVLSVKAPKKAHAGSTVKFVVRGLTPGEKVKVILRGKKVGHGKAKANGTFKVKVKLKGKKLAKRGSAKVKAVGLTSGAVGTVKIKVVR